MKSIKKEENINKGYIEKKAIFSDKVKSRG